MATKRKVKSAAILTVFDVSQMTAKGRASVCRWLLKQVSDIRKYHKKPGFASRYTARYLYR